MLTVPSADGCLAFKWWRLGIALQTGTRLPLFKFVSCADQKSIDWSDEFLMDSPKSVRGPPNETSSDEANVPSADDSLCAGRLEIRKPAQRGCFQKLEMRDRHGQFLEATLTV
jgi:hypothetical protein